MINYFFKSNFTCIYELLLPNLLLRIPQLHPKYLLLMTSRTFLIVNTLPLCFSLNWTVFCNLFYSNDICLVVGKINVQYSYALPSFPAEFVSKSRCPCTHTSTEQFVIKKQLNQIMDFPDILRTNKKCMLQAKPSWKPHPQYWISDGICYSGQKESLVLDISRDLWAFDGFPSTFPLSLI